MKRWGLGGRLRVVADDIEPLRLLDFQYFQLPASQRPSVIFRRLI